MVRADLGGAGVLFTLDVDTGVPDIVLVNAAWGLGENVVQGTIEPDQYRVFKHFLENGGRPVIEKIERVSRPGLRVYKANDELPKIVGGLGIAIVSTSRGLMTVRQARSMGIGGEVICSVY